MDGTREPSSLASLELLNTYSCRFKRLRAEQGNNTIHSATCTPPSRKELSTVDTIKVAMDKFLGFTSQSAGDASMLIHSGLSCEIDDDVEPALFLLASADKVANEQFDRARMLLSMCNQLASNTGNPVQRVVYYFAQALQERIDRKTGSSSSEGQEYCKRWLLDLEESITNLKPTLLAYGLALPLCLVHKSAGIQAILDTMVSSRRVHLIDLGIRSGMHWPFLMQALKVRHECPLESLKITAVGTSSQEIIKETGKRLSQFAETMGLPFSFKMVMVSEMNDLKEDMFELEAEETVGVYSSLVLRNFIGRFGQFETLIGVIKNLHPTVMVMIEKEADTTSLEFMDRFIGGLLHFGALFDSVEACMGASNAHRMPLEADYFRLGIQQIVTFDVEERSAWDMKIEGWRSLLNNFDMVEKELSMSSLYQANLVVDNSAYRSFCTISMDGKCLLSGWKGAPIFSVSAWEFLPEIPNLAN